MKSILFFLLISTVLLIMPGCKKYLAAKSSQSLVIIGSLQDLQSLLDNYNNINWNNPSADEVSCDEYYLSYGDYQGLSFDQARNMYTWQPADVFQPYTQFPNDWTQSYNNVYIANTVLDNMNQVTRTPTNATDWDNVQGQAYFLRAHSFFKAALIWSLAYDSSTAGKDLGIPLRLTADFNVPSVRPSVQATYARIIQDLELAIPLLPDRPLHVFRASRAAAFALLARIYLAMRAYQPAGQYADSCLQINNTLIDYNTLDSTASYPLPEFNEEVLYEATVGGVDLAPINPSIAKIDTVLFATYSGNDLRRPMFFSPNPDGSYAYIGSYDGSPYQFNGIATDEALLMRAECYARTGDVAAAMQDLNGLLVKRYRLSTFVPLVAASQQDALTKILRERQKELVMRGTRWMDIKRLNKEGYEIGLQRQLNGAAYTLPPNDLRFALAIPEDVIGLSGMAQNPR